MRIITIANFSGRMLRANAERAGIVDLFDELLSTEVNGTYKPDPRAYALGMERLGLKKDEIAFAAFGGWDAYGAKTFGYHTYWVNRFNLPQESLGLRRMRPRTISRACCGSSLATRDRMTERRRRHWAFGRALGRATFPLKFVGHLGAARRAAAEATCRKLWRLDALIPRPTKGLRRGQILV